MTDSLNHPVINLTLSSSFDDDEQKQLMTFYNEQVIKTILSVTLSFMDAQEGMSYPNFNDIFSDTVSNNLSKSDVDLWQQKPKELDIYITDITEGRALNLEARGKDYATNILSYPSELPPFILMEMPTLPLGELIICHKVVVQQAQAQNKSVTDHVQHLLVHGILHLLGFDHELGDSEADEMEGFEIAILQGLGIANPYAIP